MGGGGLILAGALVLSTASLGTPQDHSSLLTASRPFFPLTWRLEIVGLCILLP